jgi:mRNA-degrading endonuclease RelE of RelBE toxin-antitoxin system
MCNDRCACDLVFAPSVVRDLREARVSDRAHVLDEIEKRLGREPLVETRNRKPLPEIDPPFEAAPPIWELRVGGYRVFYDVDEREAKVYVRAVRRKPPHRTTGEIL